MWEWWGVILWQISLARSSTFQTLWQIRHCGNGGVASFDKIRHCEKYIWHDPLPFRHCSARNAASSLASRCRRVLECMLQPVLRAAALRLAVYLCDKVPHHPPLLPRGKNPVQLQLALGRVDLTQMRADFAYLAPEAWHKKLASELPGRSSCSLIEFLCVLFSGDRKPWRALGQQVAWEIGLFLDASFHEHAAKGGQVCPGVLVQNAAWDLDNTHQLQRDLVRYRAGSLRAAAQSGMRYVSCTCDKSRVFGMGLSNAAFCLPTNEAWWAPPAVH